MLIEGFSIDARGFALAQRALALLIFPGVPEIAIAVPERLPQEVLTLP